MLHALARPAMPHLDAFALIHPLADHELAQLQAALPDIEFIVGTDELTLPAGLERVQAAALRSDKETPLLDGLLDRAPQLRWLQARGAGVEKLVTPRLVASDLIFTNGSGTHSDNIAEHVLAMMLAFARQLPVLIRQQAERKWAWPPRARLFELGGQTLAIVGLGAIGRALAPRAAALGMQVIGVRRSEGGALPPGVVRSVGFARLDETLAAADHVVIALPQTPETEGLFSTARFAAMKKGAHVYNVGRGPLVDQEALFAALQSGQLGGAGLDVTEPEPLPDDSPLWSHPNVIITAHTAGGTPHSFARYKELLVDNIGRFRRGEPLVNVVDKALGY
jgi:phosphoglycerate dehydrogenase-like enzyme